MEATKRKIIDTKLAEFKKNPMVTELDIKQILAVLPHRSPMLLIDRVIDFVPGVSATGIKAVTVNEPFFVGHFPGNPIMPGVLIIESMAQTAGVIMLYKSEYLDSVKESYFTTIDRTRFRKPVVPGDMLQCKVQLIRNRASVSKFIGQAYVDDVLVAESNFSAITLFKTPDDKSA